MRHEALGEKGPGGGEESEERRRRGQGRGAATDQQQAKPAWRFCMQACLIILTSVVNGEGNFFNVTVHGVLFVLLAMLLIAFSAPSQFRH
eukprot:751486-Hanusia_phi.AAC.1